jgi:hypothetical protein
MHRADAGKRPYAEKLSDVVITAEIERFGGSAQESRG